MPKSGERYLFALNRNPDNKSYGISGPWSLLRLDTQTVTLSDPARTTIGFTNQTGPDDFLQEVKIAISKYEKVPPGQR